MGLAWGANAGSLCREQPVGMDGSLASGNTRSGTSRVKVDADLITYHGITMRSADVKPSPTFGVYIELDIKRLVSN
jgi:hypothetical protein